jgi:hypothetical protein
MARKATVRWHETAKAWRSDVGPYSPKTGRRGVVYFRELPASAAGRRKAQERLEAYLRDRDRREAAATTEAGNPKLGDVARAYIADQRRQVGEDELAERTLLTNATRLARLVDHPGADGVALGERPVRALTAADGARWLKELKAAGKGPLFRRHLLTAAKACLNWAARSDPEQGRAPLIDRNPFADLKRPRVPRGSRRYVTRKEMADFLRFAWRHVNGWTPIHGRCSGCVRAKRPGKCRRQHARSAALDRLTLLLARVQYHCGTRPGELVVAEWGDWEPAAYPDPTTGAMWGLIVLPPGRHKTGRKKQEDKLIPVRPTLARAIERFRASGHAHPTHLFSRPARRRADGAATAPWTSVSDLGARLGGWRDAAVAAGALTLEPGRPLTLYPMRHAWYTRAVHDAGLTADQAGSVGATSEQVVRETYLRSRTAKVVKLAAQVDRAARSGGE